MFLVVKFHDNLNKFSTKGTAKNQDQILSIAWKEGAGALWYSDQILLWPRFEIRAKITINNKGCNDPYSYAFDGFTVILSKQKDYLGGDGGSMGYDGIFDALVTEIDLYQNPTDVSQNSISIHRCYKSYCTPEEGPSTYQRNLPFNYDKCKVMVYDIYIQYKESYLSIYLNDSLIMQVLENFLPTFNGFGFLGFSGYFRGNQREIIITSDSFLCLDQLNDVYFDTSVNGAIYYNNRIPDNIPAGAPIDITAKFIDIDGLVVPHLYGLNVIGWKLTISYDCHSTQSNWKTFNYVDQIRIQNMVNKFFVFCFNFYNTKKIFRKIKIFLIIIEYFRFMIATKQVSFGLSSY